LTETQLSRTNFATDQKEWLGKHCPDFIDKDSWSPNSPDLNPVDYHVRGAMFEKLQELKAEAEITERNGYEMALHTI